MSDPGPVIENADSSRMGKAVEHLVAATCILQSRGRLNVSTSLVDDEGVDLVFHRRGGSATMAVQVKSRMSDSKTLIRGRFLAQVRSETLRPRDDLYVLGAMRTCWLVPSAEFVVLAIRDTKGRFRFAASPSRSSKDQWSRFRVEPGDLARTVMDMLPPDQSPASP